MDDFEDDKHNASELSQIYASENEYDLTSGSLDNEMDSMQNPLFSISPDDVSHISGSISSNDVQHLHVSHQIYSNMSITSKSSYISSRNPYAFETGDRSGLQMDQIHQSIHFDEAQMITKPPVSSREIDLSFKHSVFTYIESCGEELRLNFKLSQDLHEDEFLTFKVSCLPSAVFEDDYVSCKTQKLRPGVDFLRLNFALYYTYMGNSYPGQDYPPRGQSKMGIKATLYNGQYCLTIPKGQKSLIRAGNYSLVITSQAEVPDLGEQSDEDIYSVSTFSNDFTPKKSQEPEPHTENQHEGLGANHSQELQVQIRLNRELSPVTLAPHCVVEGSVGLNEMKYYRFHCRDPSKLITIRLKPVDVMDTQSESSSDYLHHQLPCQSEGLASDVDLFVSNQFDGTVPVTAENAVWRDTSCGVKTIHILPSDINLKRNNDREEINTSMSGPNPPAGQSETFLIGLLGNSDLNKFELLVTLRDAPELYYISTKPETRNVRASHSILPSYDLSPRHEGLGENISSFLISPGANVKTSKGDRPFFPDSQNTSFNVRLAVNCLHHYSLEINPSESGFVVFDLKLPQQNGSAPGSASLWLQHNDIPHFASKQGIDLSFGNGVYPSLISPFDLFDDEDDESVVKQLVVMYASNQYLYPDCTSHIWRSVGGSSSTSLILRTNEWKYINSVCYVSVCILEITKAELHLVMRDFELLHENPSRSMENNSAIDYGDGIRTDLEDSLEDFIDLLVFRKLRQQKLKELSKGSEGGSSVGQVMDGKWSLWCETDSQRVKKSNPGEISKLQIFEDLFSDIDGAKLSYKDRDCPELDKAFLFDNSHLNASNTSHTELNNFSMHKNQDCILDDQTLSYFEIDHFNFSSFLHQCGAKDGDIFYDLGCGVGKALVSAALSGIRFRKIVGIDILPSLTECAKDVILQLTSKNAGLRRSQSMSQSASAMFLQNTASTLKDSVSLRDSFSYQIAPLNNLQDKLTKLGITLPEIQIKTENFLDASWSDASFIFINSLTFSETQLSSILQKTSELKTGSRLVLANGAGPAPLEYLEVNFMRQVKEVQCFLTCGRATFFVLERL